MLSLTVAALHTSHLLFFSGQGGCYPKDASFAGDRGFGRVWWNIRVQMLKPVIMQTKLNWDKIPLQVSLNKCVDSDKQTTVYHCCVSVLKNWAVTGSLSTRAWHSAKREMKGVTLELALVLWSIYSIKSLLINTICREDGSNRSSGGPGMKAPHQWIFIRSKHGKHRPQVLRVGLRQE